MAFKVYGEFWCFFNIFICLSRRGVTTSLPTGICQNGYFGRYSNLVPMDVIRCD